MSNNANLENRQKYNESFFVNIAFVLLAFALLTTGVLIIFKDQFNLYFDFTELASLGSFLGGIITAFLTFSTILLVFATYKTQQKELAATREQLEETVRQAEITNETMLKQQFETTFFNMINMHNNLVKGLTLYGTTVKDKVVFINIYEAIINYYKEESLKSYLQGLLMRERDSLDELGTDFIKFYYKINDNEEKEFEYDVQTFVNLARKYIYENRYDEILMQDISVFNIFRFNYEELENYLVRYDYDSFIYRLKKEFVDNVEYKNTSVHIVDYRFKFPLHHYFESIISVIAFIEQSNLKDNEKNNYLRIFFSNFTTYEKTIINLYTKYKVVEDFELYFNKYHQNFEKDINFYNTTIYPDL
ncbi:putative phage abortive infection protein [Lysinibacillus sphaericus]|uniref:Phage abortive infection protein n=1 Tax=Lysinibacillus sphaericus OT4b.31 TaxID=1285586 RepID=R7Z8W3_LYSSH|nr:putative phage abortive infection protein [Lysinibacillus sphaericus]EON70469.1 hypothetical protein H131_21332 [Lysinibacillus sphaericus OT4b.31]